jgi:hypothetical protein
MATVTLSIPKELRKLMRSMPEVKWSEIFRNIIISKVQQLEKFEKISQKREI